MPRIKLTDVVLAVLALAILISIIWVLQPRYRRPPSTYSLAASNMRSIAQCLSMWASENQQDLPLPSLVDRNNDTAGPSLYKDRTGSIYSILIFNRWLVPEIVVNPSDTSMVQAYEDYEYSKPTHALHPDRAVYDPMFKGTPLDSEEHIPAVTQQQSGTMHASYALAPFWNGQFSTDPNTPAVGHRGPLYEPDPTKPNQYRPSEAHPLWGSRSNAYLYENTDTRRSDFTIVAYADGSTRYLTQPIDPATGNHLYIHGDPASGVTATQPRDHIYLRMYHRGVPRWQPFSPDFVKERQGPHVWLDGDSP